jgi:hypothetical protein
MKSENLSKVNTENPSLGTKTAEKPRSYAYVIAVTIKARLYEYGNLNPPIPFAPSTGKLETNVDCKTTKPGTVETIIKPPDPLDPKKAQIHVHGAEPLYQEIRIDNTLTDENGAEVKLKEGAEVEVHVEADKSATTPKKA